MREHWEASAANGNADSQAKLDGPPFPDCLAYLWRWAQELHGRSGVGQYGLVPLTWGTLADWAHFKGKHPSPREVDALFALDSAMTHHESREKKKPQEGEEAKATPAWPKKKAS